MKDHGLFAAKVRAVLARQAVHVSSPGVVTETTEVGVLSKNLLRKDLKEEKVDRVPLTGKAAHDLESRADSAVLESQVDPASFSNVEIQTKPVPVQKEGHSRKDLIVKEKVVTSSAEEPADPVRIVLTGSGKGADLILIASAVDLAETVTKSRVHARGKDLSINKVLDAKEKTRAREGRGDIQGKIAPKASANRSSNLVSTGSTIPRSTADMTKRMRLGMDLSV